MPFSYRPALYTLLQTSLVCCLFSPWKTEACIKMIWKKIVVKSCQTPVRGGSISLALDMDNHLRRTQDRDWPWGQRQNSKTDEWWLTCSNNIMHVSAHTAEHCTASKWLTMFTAMRSLPIVKTRGAALISFCLYFGIFRNINDSWYICILIQHISCKIHLSEPEMVFASHVGRITPRSKQPISLQPSLGQVTTRGSICW